MRIIKIVFFTGCILISTYVHSQQPDIDVLEEYYAQDRLDELDSLLRQAEQSSPGHPTVLYLKGLREKEAPAALAFFENVYNNHKNSVFAVKFLQKIIEIAGREFGPDVRIYTSDPELRELSGSKADPLYPGKVSFL